LTWKNIVKHNCLRGYTDRFSLAPLHTISQKPHNQRFKCFYDFTQKTHNLKTYSTFQDWWESTSNFINRFKLCFDWTVARTVVPIMIRHPCWLHWCAVSILYSLYKSNFHYQWEVLIINFDSKYCLQNLLLKPVSSEYSQNILEDFIKTAVDSIIWGGW